jgi:hypothetical protein
VSGEVPWSPGSESQRVDDLLEAYRITAEGLSAETTAWHSYVNVALVVNGGLLVLTGAFEDAPAIVWATAVGGLVANLLFYLVLRRIRSYLDLHEAELRGLEQGVAHLGLRTLEELLKDKREVTDDDLRRVLGLRPSNVKILRGPLRLPWVPDWHLPVVGSAGGARGLLQTFFFVLALAWVILAAIITVVDFL